MSAAVVFDEPPAASTATAKPKVTVRGVSMRFRADGKDLAVLADVDLDVGEGEFLCLLGPSGCGKSTLLNIIGGFLQPTSGEVRIDGEVVRGPDPRRIFVFQERGVFPWLTVSANVGFGLGRLDRAERQRRIDHYVSLVGLTGFEDAYPHELSGGMKQRVEVARALAVNPDVLYLDEPFGALDSITRLTMRAELLRIWAAEKKTIIFVTHDIEESIQLADRVAVMTSRPAKMRRLLTAPWWSGRTEAREYWPDYMSCVLVVRQDVIDKNPRAVQVLVDGIARSGLWLEEGIPHREHAADFVGATTSINRRRCCAGRRRTPRTA